MTWDEQPPEIREQAMNYLRVIDAFCEVRQQYAQATEHIAEWKALYEAWREVGVQHVLLLQFEAQYPVLTTMVQTWVLETKGDDALTQAWRHGMLLWYKEQGITDLDSARPLLEQAARYAGSRTGGVDREANQVYLEWKYPPKKPRPAKPVLIELSCDERGNLTIVRLDGGRKFYTETTLLYQVKNFLRDFFGLDLIVKDMGKVDGNLTGDGHWSICERQRRKGEGVGRFCWHWDSYAIRPLYDDFNDDREVWFTGGCSGVTLSLHRFMEDE